MRRRPLTPELVIVALVAVLAVAGLVGGGKGARPSDGGTPAVASATAPRPAAAASPSATARAPSATAAHPPAPGTRTSRAAAARARAREAATISPAHVALVERRVERLRGLKYLHPVPVAIVSPAQTRRIVAAEDAHGGAAARARQRASEETLKLLGLLAPGDDLDAITGDVSSQQVAGFYDPERKRLALVRGAGIDDVTLAHELTHALEDQHFGLRRFDARDAPDDDATDAVQALQEGTATLVMTRYAARYPEAAPSLADALRELNQSAAGTPLPPYVMHTLLFPYESGEQFAARLYATSGDWRLVNLAEHSRPPRTTAEIVDPDRWLRVTQPAAVTLPAVGAGGRRLIASTFGEEDTEELLRDAVGTGAAARIGGWWRGGRYALWRTGPLPARGCAAPCGTRDVLVVGWRVASPAQASALATALGSWARVTRGGRAGPDGTLRLPHGSTAAIRARGTSVRLVLAQSTGLARQLAG